MTTISSSKGDYYMSEAKKALERTTIFGFGKQQKYEDAAENYTNAGNAYKLASDFPNAAKAFIKCSQVWEQTSEKFNITNALVEAGQCYKRAQNPTNAIKALCKAIELYNDDGRIGMSAKYTQEIAEILENDHNITSAIEVYEEAAHLYDLDKMKSNSNACLTKVAQFLSTATDGNGDLKKAGGIYEKLGDESMSSRLGQYSARGYFLQALLCYLAMGDAVQVNKKITEFKNADYSFASSNECTFIQKLVKAFEEYNEDEFSFACSDYDRLSPLDPWKTSLLLKAKTFIAESTGEDVDLS